MSSRMLVVDDNAKMREVLATLFSEKGFVVTQASNGLDAIALVREQPFDVVITDYSMPGENGIGVLRATKETAPDTHVLIITAFGTIDIAVEAMRLGAADFIQKPFKLTEMELKVDMILRAREEERQAPKPIKTDLDRGIKHIVGTSAQTREMLRMIKRVGPSKSSVLITGPTGTGKELVAHAIHDSSSRHDRPFVALNCAALAPGVLESELFGHERGAFTGASDRRIGRFEKAHTGTLFLDEVGEIDTGIQTKLLRVLQSGEFERVGGTQTIRVDVRVVAATNRDLAEAIAKGLFREDFYYRLKVFSLNLEPLKNRRDDIPGLIDHFLNKFSVEMGKEISGVDDHVMEFFLRYPWPGNIRELENVLERAVVLAEDNVITRNELPQEMLYTPLDPDAPSSILPSSASIIERTDHLERELIKGALDQFHWNKTKAADHLGLKRTTLQYKIKKYGLE